jgi:hypothetical protein
MSAQYPRKETIAKAPTPVSSQTSKDIPVSVLRKKGIAQPSEVIP